MSEYQYYEFLALDRSLTSDERTRLRRISSRAEITSTRFQNEYEYGDLKADPLKLLAAHFDVFFYHGFRSTLRFAVRLPGCDSRELEPFLGGESLGVVRAEGGLLLDLCLHDRQFNWESVEGGAARLAPLREALLKGDTRWLYLAWLADLELRGEDELEPPLPVGLQELDEPLKTLAALCALDRDLLAAAVEASPPLDVGRADEEASAREWATALPARARRDMLVSFLLGRNEARDLFQRWLRLWKRPQATAPRRTVGTLLERAEEIRRERLRREADESRRRRTAQEAREREARALHLESVASQEERVWAEVAEQIALRKPQGYDKAVHRLRDLGEVLQAQGRTEEFARRVGELRQLHRLKGNLLARLDEAHLPG